MKRSIYNFLVHASEVVLWPTRFFSPKMKLFLTGRQGVFEYLQKQVHEEDRTLWFHCASLGEYEQGLPIMEGLKKAYPNHKLVISFFSPSGYEVRKNNSIGDVVCYLPLDTLSNARRFIRLVHPEMVFFIKYEFWPNYLYVLKKQEIPTYLIAGIFRKNQALFRSKRSLLRKALASFDYFFLQNQESIDLLKGIGITDAVVSGDTRFDRVSKQLEIDNKLEFMEKFKGNSMCLVCGSTWPEDESVLLPFLNSELGQKIKIVIAPHKIDHHLNKELQKKLKGQSMLYSGMDVERLPQTQVLLLDTVGFLSKVYSYADVAYVGGAMGNSGLHNILEPATFGIPIVIGKNFDNFPEAKQLKKRSGLFSIKNAEACQGVLHNLFTHSDLRAKTGTICRLYVKENTGATQMILDYIKQRDLALGVISVD